MRKRSEQFFHDYLRAGSSDTPDHILERLSESNHSRVRARVAENPKTPTAILRLLASDNDVEVRIAVATNPNTPQATVWQIANSDSVMVRMALAVELNTPVFVLDKLSCDDNPYVAYQAAKTLSIINSFVSQFKRDNDKVMQGSVTSMAS